MLHIKKQPFIGRPFIKSFQNLLRNTPVGKLFFKSIAKPETVKSILCQVLVVASENTRMSFIFYSELKAILFVVVNLQLVLP
jgi:hypothetical protein